MELLIINVSSNQVLHLFSKKAVVSTHQAVVSSLSSIRFFFLLTAVLGLLLHRNRSPFPIHAFLISSAAVFGCLKLVGRAGLVFELHTAVIGVVVAEVVDCVVCCGEFFVAGVCVVLRSL